MKYSTFKKNVQKWAEERGIYDHSTAEAQVMKALSEIGELADAIGKLDLEGVKDGIGDVAVCMVNYAVMDAVDCDAPESGRLFDITEEIGSICEAIADNLAYGIDIDVTMVNECLDSIAKQHVFTFSECLSKAWNEIKDRKGRMVEGGFFVKE